VYRNHRDETSARETRFRQPGHAGIHREDAAGLRLSRQFVRVEVLLAPAGTAQALGLATSSLRLASRVAAARGTIASAF